jgi:hypothetical protein
VKQGHPTRLLQGVIVRSHPKCSSLLLTPAKLSFHEKIIGIPNFLPEPVFNILLAAAARLVSPERVHIPVHKRGATISYHALHHHAPEIIAFYLSPAFHAWCSEIVDDRVQPTPLHDLSSCSLLIYDKPKDHIGWHFDLNFYSGRHFTALLSLVNTNAGGHSVSSANLLIRRSGEDVAIPTPPNTLVLFEGAEIYHCVTPLKEGERRVILSMTFCTDPSASALQTFERRVKDIAYFGLRALWT